MGRELPYGKPVSRETLRRKLDRPMLSERPLSAATRWETEYIDRVALCVWFASQKYVRTKGVEGGGRGKKEGGARSPLHVAQLLHSSTVGSQRGLKFPRSMRGITSYFLFRRAVGGRGSEGSRRERVCPFFFLSSTLSKSHRRRGTGR